MKEEGKKRSHLVSSIREAAVTNREAASQSMALFTFKGDGGTHAMLVDFPRAASLLQKELTRTGKSYAIGGRDSPRGGSDAENVMWDITAAVQEAIEPAVVGYIKFSRIPSAGSVAGADRKDAFMIHLASAESGYGPLMYDLALSLAYPNYIMADRQSVSPGAFAVWQYYLQNRSADVARVPLEGVRTGKTDMPESRPSKAAKEAWELSLLNMQIRDTKEDMKGPIHWEPEEIRRLQKDLAVLLKKKERQEKRMETLLQGDPLAWKFKIKRPLGTARLSANAQKLVEGLIAVAVQVFQPKNTYEVNVLRQAVKNVLNLRDSLLNIGDDFFQKKYKP